MQLCRLRRFLVFGPLDMHNSKKMYLCHKQGSTCLLGYFAEFSLEEGAPSPRKSPSSNALKRVPNCGKSRIKRAQIGPAPFLLVQDLSSGAIRLIGTKAPHFFKDMS